MANREISWETTTVANIGVDANLGKRFSVVAEYYHKKTGDILLTLDVPKITGLEAPYQNAGTVENKGWDLGLNYSNRDNKFKYDIGFNISDVRNKVLET
jgi:outer membrane receptor protein involved in Fe transport